jgi:hypothetical protein
MAFDKIKRFFSGKYEADHMEPAFGGAVPDVKVASIPIPPVSPDRQTVDYDNLYGSAVEILVSQSWWLSPKYNFEWLDILDSLFLYDPNFAKVLHTHVTLGNSGHEIVIDAPSKRQAELALQTCNDFAARCFPRGGGLDGIINTVLGQNCRTSGMAVEFVPSADIHRVEFACPIAVKTLRYRYGPNETLILGQLQNGIFHALNPLQVSFMGTKFQDGNPYPIPAALAALKPAIANKIVRDALTAWFERLPLPGVGWITAHRPPQLPGESQEAYTLRCTQLLNTMVRDVGDNLFSAGLGVSYDDTDFKFQQTSSGGAGARHLLQCVEEDLFAGLKMDPILFGRSYSRTETWARVVFEELTNSLKNSQQGVKRLIEHGHRFNLSLSGQGNVGVSVAFNDIRGLDTLIDSNARLFDVQGIIQQYEAGLVSKDEARSGLGYNKTRATSGDYIASFSRADNQYSIIEAPQNVWQVQNTFDKPDVILVHSVVSREMGNAAREYRWEIEKTLTDAGRSGVQAVSLWAEQHMIPEVDSFVEFALKRFLSGSEHKIDIPTLSKLSNEYITKVYSISKHDPDLFGADWKTGGGLGIHIGAHDQKAIDYMTNVDRFYVSKYVSNSPQREEEIRDFLREEYLEKGLGRGVASKREFARFQNKFGDLVDEIGTDAAGKIIDTSVSRAKNWSHILTLSQEKITKFKVISVHDSRTCSWCLFVDGKTFKVEKEKKRIERVIDSGSEDQSEMSPFLRNRYNGQSGYDRLVDSTIEQIEDGGGAAPPLHPRCRCTVVAQIEENEAHAA